MQQQVKEAPIGTGTVQPQSAQSLEVIPPTRDGAARWRALAGMAISLTLACLIVTLEFTSQATHRLFRMHRRAEALLSRVSRLESEIAAERARIAAAHRELAAAQTLRALLRAPDAGMLRLFPPASASAAGGHKAAKTHRPEAVLAFSPGGRSAVLMVVGLNPAAGDTLDDSMFVLWWSVSHGAPVRAAEFRTAADGSALVTAAMPPGLEVTAAMITAERAAKESAANAVPASAPTAPSGPLQLRGTLSR